MLEQPAIPDPRYRIAVFLLGLWRPGVSTMTDYYYIRVITSPAGEYGNLVPSEPDSEASSITYSIVAHEVAFNVFYDIKRLYVRVCSIGQPNCAPFAATVERGASFDCLHLSDGWCMYIRWLVSPELCTDPALKALVYDVEHDLIGTNKHKVQSDRDRPVNKGSYTRVLGDVIRKSLSDTPCFCLMRSVLPLQDVEAEAGVPFLHRRSGFDRLASRIPETEDVAECRVRIKGHDSTFRAVLSPATRKKQGSGHEAYINNQLMSVVLASNEALVLTLSRKKEISQFREVVIIWAVPPYLDCRRKLWIDYFFDVSWKARYRRETTSPDEVT